MFSLSRFIFKLSGLECQTLCLKLCLFLTIKTFLYYFQSFGQAYFMASFLVGVLIRNLNEATHQQGEGGNTHLAITKQSYITLLQVKYTLKAIWTAASVDLDKGSFLTFVFSKVAIFGNFWKTFKGQSINICFTFEVQRSLQTKTLKLQRLLKKPLSETMLTHLQPPFKRQRLKTIICLGLVDPITLQKDFTL